MALDDATTDPTITAAVPAGATTPPPEPDAGATPWRKEVDEYFADHDEEFRTKVDSYLRDKRQPYVTKLEQERGDLADKAAWFDDLQDDPADTLRDAIEQAFSPEVAAKFVALVEEGATQEVALAAAQADPPERLTADERSALDFAKEQKATSELNAYLAEVADVVKANPHVKEQTYHLYVKETGSLQDALELYNKDYPPPAAEVPAGPLPPATLTGGGGGTPVAAAPVSLDDLGRMMFDAAGGR